MNCSFLYLLVHWLVLWNSWWNLWEHNTSLKRVSQKAIQECGCNNLSQILCMNWPTPHFWIVLKYSVKYECIIPAISIVVHLCGFLGHMHALFTVGLQVCSPGKYWHGCKAERTLPCKQACRARCCMVTGTQRRWSAASTGNTGRVLPWARSWWPEPKNVLWVDLQNRRIRRHHGYENKFTLNW